MRTRWNTGRGRTYGRRASTLMAVGAVLAAGLVGTVTPASAANSVSAKNWIALAGQSTPDREGQIPAPEKPKQLRPTQRVLTKATNTTAAGTAATMSTSTIVAGAASLQGESVTAAAAAAAPAGVSGAGAPGADAREKTLVLYDSTGPYSWLGEVYGEQTANLVSHFNAWTAHPVTSYQAGEIAGYTSIVYVGSTYDEPLPVEFLDDVTSTTKDVVWIYDNIWQLTARDPNFVAKHGFTWKQFDLSAVSTVNYKGTSLTRDTINGSGIMDHVIYDATKVQVLGTAVRPDGTTFPWAVRSGNLTYVGEIPFAYVTHDDRYLAFADLLFDSLGTVKVGRHQALARIEDVGPDADPAELRAVADYLSSQKVPFSVAVYPRYRDPNGVENTDRKDQDYTLADRPQVVSALKYMVSKGGTLLMHGYTHQYRDVANPYDGISANDFEFYRAHIDSANNVVYDGPVAEDSTSWINGRISSSATAFTKAGLTKPTIFEFPHYAGSAVDYRAVTSAMGTRYDRGLYFPGVFKGGSINYARLSGQFFPYTVRDVYGSNVVPENLGNVEPEWFNNHPPRFPSDILASAQRNLVIRDSVASFFYHPYLGTSYLTQIVSGLKGMGYTFVSPATILAG